MIDVKGFGDITLSFHHVYIHIDVINDSIQQATHIVWFKLVAYIYANVGNSRFDEHKHECHHVEKVGHDLHLKPNESVSGP